MAAKWICPVLLVVIDGEAHRVQTNVWDQVAYKRHHGRPITKADEDDPETVAWLAWTATVRVGLFAGSYDDFVRAIGNIGVDGEDQSPVPLDQPSSDASSSAA